MPVVSNDVLGKFTTLEQNGASPDSGTTSKLMSLATQLEALGYGSTAAGGWGDWGASWNRIYSAGLFTFSGNLTVGEVALGKTFYSGSNVRTQKIGTNLLYYNQQFVSRDDFGGPNGSGAEDYQLEESTWTSPAADIWLDTRSGLYWTGLINAATSNNFTMSTCPFFSTTPRGAYNAQDANCGSAINICSALTSGSRTDWYLPSQKELAQAYVDGMYNQAGTTLANAASFTTENFYWSSTEVSYNASNAEIAALSIGSTSYLSKVNATDVAVLCVARN